MIESFEIGVCLILGSPEQKELVISTGVGKTDGETQSSRDCSCYKVGKGLIQCSEPKTADKANRWTLSGVSVRW